MDLAFHMFIIYCLLILFFIYSTTMIVNSGYIQHSYAQYSQDKIQNSTIYYGCEEYSKIFHCDRLHNNFEIFKIPSNSTTLYHATDTPIFVPGKDGLALQMY